MSKPFGFPIKQRTWINKTPEQVYDAITSGETWNQFFTHATTIETKAGGDIIWRWKDWGPDFYSVESPGKVVAVDRPNKFAFTWGSKTVRTIIFNLSPLSDGTVVHLTEDGYGDTGYDRESILACASGWGEAVTLLKFWLEFGVKYSQPKKPEKSGEK